MRNPKDLRTLETIDLIPVDLNSLLYNSERTIAAFASFRHRRDGGQDDAVARRFEQQADARGRAILAMYDAKEGFFFDRRWRTGELVTDRPSLAAAEPLYFGIATDDQGKHVAARLERDFLKPGGFVTTNFMSGQQWDGPNGWPHSSGWRSRVCAGTAAPIWQTRRPAGGSPFSTEPTARPDE